MQDMKITEKFVGPVRGEFFRTASSHKNHLPTQEKTSNNANNDETSQKDKFRKDHMKTDEDANLCKDVKLEYAVLENADANEFRFNFVIEDF